MGGRIAAQYCDVISSELESDRTALPGSISTWTCGESFGLNGRMRVSRPSTANNRRGSAPPNLVWLLWYHIMSENWKPVIGISSQTKFERPKRSKALGHDCANLMSKWDSKSHLVKGYAKHHGRIRCHGSFCLVAAALKQLTNVNMAPIHQQLRFNSSQFNSAFISFFQQSIITTNFVVIIIFDCIIITTIITERLYTFLEEKIKVWYTCQTCNKQTLFLWRMEKSTKEVGL